MVGCDVPNDVGEVMSDEFHVVEGVSTGRVSDGRMVVETGLGGVVGDVPVSADVDELDKVKGGTRVADTELGTGVREIAVPFCVVDEGELADGIAGSSVELAVVVFHDTSEELDAAEVSVMVARVPDSVSTVEVNVMLEFTGSFVELILDEGPEVRLVKVTLELAVNVEEAVWLRPVDAGSVALLEWPGGGGLETGGPSPEDVEVVVVLKIGGLAVTEPVKAVELFAIQVPVVKTELVDEDPDTVEDSVAEVLLVEMPLLRRTEPVIEASEADVLVRIGQRVLSDADDDAVPVVTAVDGPPVVDDQLPDRRDEVEELSVPEVGG
ncbi:hypothetical protein CSOJ01_05384 [Colletotrichum sojae]|uniref:Uncharacterized protein n=1 Tax=Colletotrichum sojae TaxID=2175907 RepID=A0A8H6JFZ4_9PEZI|nr:hypothetical protein CSOJ01_05384 [Colletotrichum sojae]